MGLVAGPIIVELTPSRVRVSCEPDQSIDVAPILYLSADLPTPQVVAIGDRDVVTRPSIRVSLFSSDSGLPSSVSKLLCLTLFFRFLIATVVQKGLFRLRPPVIVRGSRSLTAIFAGYERELLIQALKDAGAKTVAFEDA